MTNPSSIVERATDGDAPTGPQGARPGVLVALDQSAGAIVGLDFGHDGLRVAIADLSSRGPICGGDTGCQRVIADAGRVVGRAVADLCNYMNPDLVSSVASSAPPARSCSSRCARPSAASPSRPPSTTSRSSPARSAIAPGSADVLLLAVTVDSIARKGRASAGRA